MALGESGGRHAVRGRVWYLVHHYGRRWMWFWAVCIVTSGLRLLDLCCCGSHAHADRDTIQVLLCRVLCSSRYTRFLVFFLACKLNGLAWYKQAVTRDAAPKRETQPRETTKSERRIMLYMYKDEQECKSDLASTAAGKRDPGDFPKSLQQSYVPPASTLQRKLASAHRSVFMTCAGN